MRKPPVWLGGTSGDTTLKIPLPLSATGEALVLEVAPTPVVVAVPVLVGATVLDEAVWYLGRYLMPVEGQVEPEPTGSTGTNSPVWIEPRTLKWYHSSLSSCLLLQSMTTLCPKLAFSAAWMAARVYVVVVDGTIPASASHLYDGRVLKTDTVLLK